MSSRTIAWGALMGVVAALAALPAASQETPQEGERRLSQMTSLEQRCEAAVRDFSPYKGKSMSLAKDDWGHDYTLDDPDKLVADYIIFTITGLPDKASVTCIRYPNNNAFAAISSNRQPLFCGEVSWSLNLCHTVFDPIRLLSDNPKYREATEQSRAQHLREAGYDACIDRVRRDSQGAYIALADPRVDATGRYLIQQSIASREAECSGLK